MTFGTAADGGLLSERRTVATAPTLPPPSEPTDEQIAAFLAIERGLIWRRHGDIWRGYRRSDSAAHIEWLYHNAALRYYAAKNHRPLP